MASNVTIRLRALEQKDRPHLAELIHSIAAFSAVAKEIAIEIIDARLARPELDDYRFVLAWSIEERGPEQLAGFVCYGPTPMTQSTYDLYWLGTASSLRRLGVGRCLVAQMEKEIAKEGGTLVRAETASRNRAAAGFYPGVGFVLAATLDSFYAPGNAMLLFTKRLNKRRRAADLAR